MDMILLVVTIMLVFVNITKGQDCELEYHFYEKENMCIKVISKLKTFRDAVDFCKSSGTSFVEIYDKEKETFLRGKKDLLYGKTYRAWSGVSDFDMDGVYEYRNGTLLKTFMPGLGVWSDNFPPNQFLRKLALCPAFGKFNGPWVSMECSDENLFFCEKPLEPVTAVDIKVEEGCTMETCLCKKEEWIYFEARKLYFKVNKVAKNFTTSAMICEKLAGQLLKVPDKATETFIRNMEVSWDPVGIRYWTGLTTRLHRWTWMDGTKLLPTDYSNWFADPYVGEECVSAVWDYWGRWRGTKCSQNHYHVCQASAPCTAHPVLKVDGKVQSNNVKVRKINDGESKFRCDIQGYEGIVTEVKVVFDVGSSTVKSHARLVEMTVYIDITMHGKSCVCQLKFTDGKTEKTTVFIDFKTRPRLVYKNNNNTFDIQSGDEVVQMFEIYANPRPHVFELLKNGSPTKMAEYNVTVQPLDKPFFYKVTVMINGTFSPSSSSGTYALVIGNGIMTNLEYVFTLRLKRASKSELNPEERSTGSCFSFNFVMVSIMLLMLAALILITIMICKAKRKQKPKEEIEQGEEDKSDVDQIEETSVEMNTDDDPPNPAQKRYGRYKSTILD